MEFDLVIEQRRGPPQPRQPEDRQGMPELSVIGESERGHQPALVERQILEEQSPGFHDRSVSADAEFGVDVARSPGVKLRVAGPAQKFSVIGLPSSQADREHYFIGDSNRRAEGLRLFVRASLRINSQVPLLFDVEAERGEKLPIDAEHPLARKEMIETRECLQKSQIGLRRIINRNAGFSREQPRKRVDVTTLGLRQDLSRLPGELFIIESRQFAAHRKAVVITESARAVVELFEAFGAQILRGLNHAGSTGEQVPASNGVRLARQQRAGFVEGNCAPPPIDSRFRFVVLDLVGNLTRAGQQIALRREGDQPFDASSLGLSPLGRLFEFCAQLGDGGRLEQIAVLAADARGFAVWFAAGTEKEVFAMKLGVKIAEALMVFAKHCALSISLRIFVRKLRSSPRRDR